MPTEKLPAAIAHDPDLTSKLAPATVKLKFKPAATPVPEALHTFNCPVCADIVLNEHNRSSGRTVVQPAPQNLVLRSRRMRNPFDSPGACPMLEGEPAQVRQIPTANFQID
jgi:hypothetical protein